MSKQSQAFFKGQKMTNEEIKEYFKKKAATRKGGFDLETQRLLKEIEVFEDQWFDKVIGAFLDSKEGKKFIEAHEDQNPDEAFEILLKQSNIGALFNKALKKKIDELRGVVQ